MECACELHTPDAIHTVSWQPREQTQNTHADRQTNDYYTNERTAGADASVEMPKLNILLKLS